MMRRAGLYPILIVIVALAACMVRAEYSNRELQEIKKGSITLANRYIKRAESEILKIREKRKATPEDRYQLQKMELILMCSRSYLTKLDLEAQIVSCLSETEETVKAAENPAKVDTTEVRLKLNELDQALQQASADMSKAQTQYESAFSEDIPHPYFDAADAFSKLKQSKEK